MKNNKLFLVLALLVLALVSCKKDHYDVSHVNGVNAEGELLLPIATKSFTMMDMMARFHIDSLINCSETGELSYGYYFEDNDAVNGNRMLKFKDLNHYEHFAFDNPYTSGQPPITDTMISLERTIRFESDHISVLEAVMKMGRLNFRMVSNVGNLRRVVLRSSDIKDSTGHDFVFDAQVQDNAFGFDLAGLHYLTDTANTLTFSYDLYCYYYPSSDPELFVDISIQGRDLAMQTMRGYVEAYSSRNRIDTLLSLFPDNLTGMLDVEGVSMKIRERNTFPLGARLVVDTALVTGEGMEPYSILEPLPLEIDLPSQTAFGEVFNKSLHGRINASGGRAYSSSDFIVNPSGMSEMVTVDDTCCIDLRIDVDIPFAFKVDNVQYLDTVNMKLSELEMPDMIESITLDLTFTSTIPLNLNGKFYMYDSETGMVTDTLLSDARLIQASFDGQPTTTSVGIEITEERIEKVLHSDRIIMVYEVDTEARDVKLNANQKLDLFTKAKVKYNGVVEQ